MGMGWDCIELYYMYVDMTRLEQIVRLCVLYY
jgi:hypothetical protein